MLIHVFVFLIKDHKLILNLFKNFDHLMKVPQTFECVKIDKKEET